MILQPTDLLRRSTPTPLSADLWVKSRAVRLETNSLRVLDCARAAFANDDTSRPGRPEFLWRVVVEADRGAEATPPPTGLVSDYGLSFVSMGQYSFIAVDLRAREAMVFLEERVAKDELRFERLFLSTLVKLTGPALKSPTDL